MEVRIKRTKWQYANILMCPDCDGPNLHQTSVNYFYRFTDPKKDEPDFGLHVNLEYGNLHVDTDMTENPSSRRDGIIISFWCEVCDRTKKLYIIQHKGNEFIEWR